MSDPTDVHINSHFYMQPYYSVISKLCFFGLGSPFKAMCYPGPTKCHTQPDTSRGKDLPDTWIVYQIALDYTSVT